MEPWWVELEGGRPEVAWALFLERYRPLILATIRRLVWDRDEVMDVFTAVCEDLRSNDLARLGRYSQAGITGAQFSTWLVPVVRNRAIDHLRATHGRRRLPARVKKLNPLQREIAGYVFSQGLTHAETFERLRSAGAALSFAGFLKELAAVYRALQPGGLPHRRGADPSPEAEDPDAGWAELAESDRRAVLERAMADVPSVDRAAVMLYVMDGLSAGEVARVLGLRDSKAVYNRVYRTLEEVRLRLARDGYFHPHDV